MNSRIDWKMQVGRRIYLGIIGTRGTLETFQKKAMTCSILDMTEERWIPSSPWILQ